LQFTTQINLAQEVASSGKNSGTSSNNNINSSNNNNNNNRLLPPDKLRKNHINSNCKQRSLSMSLSDSPPLSLSLSLTPSLSLSIYANKFPLFLIDSVTAVSHHQWRHFAIISFESIQKT